MGGCQHGLSPGEGEDNERPAMRNPKEYGVVVLVASIAVGSSSRFSCWASRSDLAEI